MATSRSSTRRTPARKAANRSTATSRTKKQSGSERKYSPEASEFVEEEMKEMKEGKLKSSSGQTVHNPKQAIAIGLSEARKAGKKVPPKKAA